MTKTLKRYKGVSSRYVEFASREGEVLAVSLDYGVNYSGIGAFLARFAVRLEDNVVKVSPLKVFNTRNQADSFKVINENGEKTGERISAVRLNKVAIPVFKPGPSTSKMLDYADQHQVWALVASWLKEQAEADGFTVMAEDLASLIRSQFVVPDPKLVLEFPDLTAQKEESFDSPPPSKGKSSAWDEPDEEDEDVDE